MSVADPFEWIKEVLLEFGFRLATNGAAAEHAYEGLGEGIPALLPHLSVYVGPMPRCVVPSIPAPRRNSRASSIR